MFSCFGESVKDVKSMCCPGVVVNMMTVKGFVGF